MQNEDQPSSGCDPHRRDTNQTKKALGFQSRQMLSHGQYDVAKAQLLKIKPG